MRGKIIPATKYRKEIFKKIIEHVKSMEGLADVAAGGHCNQDAASKEVQYFLQNFKLKTCIKMSMNWMLKN